jgi:lipopolysaccharide/colanic/teichoic acid biosynthesis glycosyltransferase
MRALELLLVALLAPLCIPLALGIAVAVRIVLGTPILFRQERIGLGEQAFMLYKFRTMHTWVGEDGELLPDGERRSRFGSWLRRTSLDELPQLWNVLRGDLALVGPRPLLVRYLPWYTPEERLRHSVRPGITGWAQINGRNLLSWDHRLALDVFYVRRKSLGFDLRILALTAGAVFRKKGYVENVHDVMQDLDVERQARV